MFAIDLPRARRLALRVVLGQAAVTVIAAMCALALGGERASVSALLGGGIATVASLAMAGLVFGVLEEFWKRNIRGLRCGVLLSVFAWTMIAALLVPIVAFVPMAFTASTFLSFPPQNFSLRWFEEFAASPLWLGAMIRSFGIGFATAAITVVPGPDDDSVDRDRDRSVLLVRPDVSGGDGSRYHHRPQRHRHANRVRGPAGDLQGTQLESRRGGVDAWGRANADVPIGDVAAGQERRCRRLCDGIPAVLLGADDRAVRRRRTEDDAAEADVGRNSLAGQPGHRGGIGCRAVGCDPDVRDHRMHAGTKDRGTTLVVI